MSAAITIWLDKDPCTLGDDATEADVDRYHDHLKQLLLDEFDDVDEIVVRRQIGGWRWRCQDHSGVDERIREIESGDEWIGLAAETEADRRDRWQSMLTEMGITLIDGESNALSGPALDRAYAATVALLS